MNTICVGKKVAIAYKLYVDGADGELVEEVTAAEPMRFTVGDGQALGALEQHLMGKSAGDDFSVFIACSEAHGEESDECLVEYPKETFINEQGEWEEDLFEVGEVIPMQDEEGNEIIGVVAEVKLNTLVLDFNHPLAGEDIYFEGKVLSVE